MITLLILFVQLVFIAYMIPRIISTLKEGGKYRKANLKYYAFREMVQTLNRIDLNTDDSYAGQLHILDVQIEILNEADGDSD